MASDKRPSADKTRHGILRAARKLFVKQGFAATSISQIAAKAKINQSLIYHHFGDKEKLWRQVKSEILHLQSDSFMQLLNAELSGKSFIDTYIHTRIDLVVEHPELQRMINWQRLESTPEKLRGSSAQLTHENWIKAIEKMQQRKQFRSDWSAKFIHSLLHSIANGYSDTILSIKPSSAGIEKFKRVACRMLCVEILP